MNTTVKFRVTGPTANDAIKNVQGYMQQYPPNDFATDLTNAVQFSDTAQVWYVSGERMLLALH